MCVYLTRLDYPSVVEGKGHSIFLLLLSMVILVCFPFSSVSLSYFNFEFPCASVDENASACSLFFIALVN